MTTITLHTNINAPIKTVFDLSRSIDFHMESASKTQEKAIAGRTSGLISKNETVTWQGRHFGLLLKHTSKIIRFEPPYSFTDIMIEGHFKYFVHQHIFTSEENGTVMKDILNYSVPYAFFGRLFNKIYLKKYLTRFLETRNEMIKLHAE